MNNDKLIRETYNKIAQKYDEKYFNDTSDLPHLNKFLSYLPKNAKVLDVGCGPGTFTQYVYKKFDVEGIDISEEMLKIARKKFPDVLFKNMDMKHMTYENNSFDAIVAGYSFIHIAEDEVVTTLEEFHRILKPSGYVFIMAMEGEKDQIVAEPLLKSEKTFINFFSLDRLSNYLKEVGFHIEFKERVLYEDLENLTTALLYITGKKQ